MKIKFSILILFLCLPLMGQELENPTVLLVSDNIQHADLLSQAADEEVLVINYLAESTDLHHLYSLIKDKLAGRLAANIGFATHDLGEAKFYLTGTETITLFSTLNHSGQQQFWKDIGKLLADDGRIDLLACNLARGEQGKMLLSSIAELSGVNVAASTNETGNPPLGGDWILETDKIDISHLYFNSAGLEKFDRLLWAEVKKINSTDGAESDYFGGSVSISGDYAIIGAEGDDDNGSGSGSAYIFYRNQGGSENWGQIKKLLATDGDAEDFLGTSVSISGDYAVVGAPGDNDNGLDSGSAYVYFRNFGSPDNWGFIKKLTPADGEEDDYFGFSVSIAGDVILAGADLDNIGTEVANGSAYIFNKDLGGADNWGEHQKLTASDTAPYDYFGASVSLSTSGDYAIIGADGNSDQGSESGSAYIFYRHQAGLDTWGEVAKLIPSDGAEDFGFGHSVSISGDNAIVGTIPMGGAESAYIFSRNQGGNDNWGEVKKLVASDGNIGDSFGFSVSISGDNAIVSAPIESLEGSTYVFSRNMGGNNNWGEKEKLKPVGLALQDLYGANIVIAQDTIVIGAVEDRPLGIGSAYVYKDKNIVTVSKVPHGQTDFDGDNIVDAGGNITITATADLGYVFVNWSGDASGSDNPLTIDPVLTDLTITPVFARLTGTLNVSINAGASGGSFSITGPPDFNGGSNLTGQTGNFSEVVPTGTYTLAFTQETGYGVTITPTTFTTSGYIAGGVITANATETVTGTYADGQYTVFVNGTNGGTTNHDGSNTVSHGDSLTITATPNLGYNFTSWTGDIISNDNPLTISNINSDLILTPNFSQGMATLNVNLVANGSGGSFSISGPGSFNGGNPLAGQTTNFSSNVPLGTYVVTYAPISNYGIVISSSEMTVVSNIATGQLADGETATVSGTYNQNQYTVTVSISSGGSTDHDGVTPISHGGNMTISATPSTGYEFVGWQGNINSVQNPLTITNITGDIVIAPVFRSLPGKGNLKVTLLGTKDGRWRLSGEQAWRGSGITLLNLSTGEHVIKCKPVQGFHTPENKPVLINKKQTTFAVISYLPLKTKPQVHYFTATPDLVEPGGIVTLEWEVDGADEFTINNSVNSFREKKGSELIRVDADTTFELKASNEDGSSKAKVDVSIGPKPEIIIFDSDLEEGAPLFPGDNTLLTWSVSGADRLILENITTGSSTVVAASGSLKVVPSETTKYSLVASSSTLSSKSSLEIKVSNEVFINSFTSNYRNIFNGNKVTLSWDVQGTDTVEINPGIGEVASSGSSEVQVTENTSFTLVAGELEKTLQVKSTSKAPDLTVSFLDIKDKADKKLKKPTVGQLTSVSAKLENTGKIACSNVVLRLVNQNRVIDEIVVDGLNPGKNKTVEFCWIPHTNGRHKLQLIADPLDTISELSETNNLSKKKVRVIGIGGVDLVIDDLNVEPLDGYKGKVLKVSYSIYNLGTEKSDSFQFQVYLTKGAKQRLNKALALVADEYMDSLAPGEKVMLTQIVELSKLTKKLHLHGLIDIHDAIIEVSKENNHLVKNVN